MRYDEVSAKYAEFGEFFLGKVVSAESELCVSRDCSFNGSGQGKFGGARVNG